MKYIICLSSLLFIVTSCSSQKVQTQTKLNFAINKCFELKRKLMVDNVAADSCISCFEQLVLDFPDSIRAYQLLINEYIESNDFNSKNQIIQKCLSRFGPTTDLLIQKNFASYSEKKIISDKDIKLLIARYHSDQINESQKLDLGVLLSLDQDFSNFNQIVFSNDEKELIKQISKTK